MNKITLLSLLTVTLLLSGCHEEKKASQSAETPNDTLAIVTTPELNSSEKDAKEAIKKAAEVTQRLAIEKAKEMKENISKTIEETNTTQVKEIVDEAVTATKDAFDDTKEKIHHSLEDINTTKASQMIDKAANLTKSFMGGAKDMLQNATAPETNETK